MFEGHADFVKTLLWVGLPGGGAWLLSGSADKSIVVWNAETGEKLATLKGHTRAVGTLAVDPVLSDDVNAVLFSGGSEREVRRWTVPWAGPAAAVEAADTLGIHDTSVYKIAFLGEDADFWSSSADGTARRVDVRGTGEADTVLKHGDYVNDVVMAGEGRWVCTACRDEDVRVWDVASGELWHTFEGHADEVSALAVVGEKQDLLVSVSIDCTVRTWSLKPADLEAARVEAARIREGGVVEVKEEVKDDGVKLSAEEEAELAELMDDSD